MKLIITQHKTVLKYSDGKTVEYHTTLLKNNLECELIEIEKELPDSKQLVKIILTPYRMAPDSCYTFLSLIKEKFIYD